MPIGTQQQKRKYSTSPDKSNRDTEQKENIKRIHYPELCPGRALVNLATQNLIEIFHGVEGHTETCEELKTSKQEYYDKKYRTPEGQNYGGIITEYHLRVHIRDLPEPNEHGEIPVDADRPSEDELVEISPHELAENHLYADDHYPNPLLLVERPQLTYDEISIGETWNIINWYWPKGNSRTERLRDPTELPYKFPEFLNIDYDKETFYKWKGIEIPTDANQSYVTFGSEPITPFSTETEADTDNTSENTVSINAEQKTTVTLQGTSSTQSHNHSKTTALTSSAGSIHITSGRRKGARHIEIDNPKGATDDIYRLPHDTFWGKNSYRWGINLTREDEGEETIISNIIDQFKDSRYNITIDIELFEKHASTETVVIPKREETIEMDALVDHVREMAPRNSVTLPDSTTAPNTLADIYEETEEHKTPDSINTTFSLLNEKVKEGGVETNSRKITVTSGIPSPVKNQWNISQPDVEADVDEQSHAWYHPHTGGEIQVVPVAGWGVEYEIYVKQTSNNPIEHVVTLADESLAAETVIDHMEAIAVTETV